MGDPYIEQKKNPPKLDTAPSIQREATKSRGTPLKGANDATKSSGSKENKNSQGTPTKATLERRAAKKEAEGLGIDTKRLTTREIKATISEKKEAQKDLADFITKVIGGLPKNNAPAAAGAPPTVVTAKSEDLPSKLGADQGKHGGVSSPTDVSDNGVIDNFYCFYKGKIGYIPLLTKGFVALPTA
jgi:hypothetical protein